MNFRFGKLVDLTQHRRRAVLLCCRSLTVCRSYGEARELDRITGFVFA